MLIITNNSGQMANRIFLFAHLIAHAIEYKYPILHLGFGKYKELFPALQADAKNNKFRVLNNRIINGLLRYHQLQNIMMLLSPCIWLNPKRFVGNPRGYSSHLKNSCQTKRIVIISDWLFRNNDLLQKHHDEVCKIFKPDKLIIERSKSIVQELRKRKTFLVGIHIRRGDYEHYLGGKLFYADTFYHSVIEKMSSLLSSDVSFLICTNDANLTMPDDLCDYFISKEDPMADIKLLSMCDYIIGPPSTFSGWASFIGKVPKFHIEATDQAIDLESFSIQMG